MGNAEQIAELRAEVAELSRELDEVKAVMDEVKAALATQIRRWLDDRARIGDQAVIEHAGFQRYFGKSESAAR